MDSSGNVSLAGSAMAWGKKAGKVSPRKMTFGLKDYTKKYTLVSTLTPVSLSHA